MRDQVYFIQAPSGQGPVKIGYSADVQKRLASLRVASPTGLEIVALVDGDRRQEAALHRKFAAHRLHGEWFAMHDDLGHFISDPKPLDIEETTVSSVEEFIREWGIGQFASDLGIAYFHANAMLRRNSIPVEYWARVIAASIARGAAVDANDLLAMVTPRLPRSKPLSHISSPNGFGGRA